MMGFRSLWQGICVLVGVVWWCGGGLRASPQERDQDRLYAQKQEKGTVEADEVVERGTEPLKVQPSQRLVVEDFKTGRPLPFADMHDQERYYRLASQLRCPTCTGLSILQSDAPFSLQLKKVLYERVIDVQASDADVMGYFTDRYGLWILREPPKEGMHLLVWLIPLLFLCAAPVFLFLRMGRGSRPSPAEASSVVALNAHHDAHIRAKMHAQLDALRAQESAAADDRTMAMLSLDP